MDKRIPYVDITMRRSAALPLPVPPSLPAGHAYRLYRPGDAMSWSRIEHLAGEFNDENSALRHFTQEFLPHETELARRMAFIADETGRPIATATAWFHAEDGKPEARLHWV
ncbi:MAG: GNAT family N-acetyltransferase, partial [Clostridia bacterium]|nr:GNAT family N-acetyltransferase [Clostridia bacterium]